MLIAGSTALLAWQHACTLGAGHLRGGGHTAVIHSSQQQGEPVLPGGKGQAIAGANAWRALPETAAKAGMDPGGLMRGAELIKSLQCRESTALYLTSAGSVTGGVLTESPHLSWICLPPHTAGMLSARS